MIRRVIAALPMILMASRLFAAAPCESLTFLYFGGNSKVTTAETILHGTFVPPDGIIPDGNPYSKAPEFCRLVATLKPQPASTIQVEIWLPNITWNRKLLVFGNSGSGGSINYADMAAAVTAGYVAASTDSGHAENVQPFSLSSPDRFVDFAYRAIHESTLTAKYVIDAFYNRPPRYSYFKGCGTGGRQALTAAEFYPTDFDGIIAGDAAINPDVLHASQLWSTAIANSDDASRIPEGKFPAIHKAVVAACDAADGARDGLIENPRQCKFDPAALLCKAGDNATCLTAPQVEIVKKIYAGPGVFPGYELGSEGAWSSLLEKPLSLAYDMYRYLVLKDPNWDYKKIDVSREWDAFDKALGDIINTGNPDLKGFFDRGGKLLIYHGWANAEVPAANSVNYYNQLVKAEGGATKADTEVRLFMLPGVGACGTGEGAGEFDSVSALEQWREKSEAPDSIVASHVTDGAVDRTHPLCPYPRTAQYKGSGDVKDAANFVCK